MKKILAAAFLLCFTGGAIMAQTTTPKTGTTKHEASTAVKQKAKPSEATVATTAKHTETAKVKTAENAKPIGKTPVKATVKSADKVKTATTAAPLKKDGTPDKRYKANKQLKKDGTPDKRFKANQHH